MAKRLTQKQQELRKLNERLKYYEKRGYVLNENAPNFSNKTAKQIHDIRGNKLLKYLDYNVYQEELGFETIPQDSSSTYSVEDVLTRIRMKIASMETQIVTKRTFQTIDLSEAQALLMEMVDEALDNIQDDSYAEYITEDITNSQGITITREEIISSELDKLREMYNADEVKSQIMLVASYLSYYALDSATAQMLSNSIERGIL